MTIFERERFINEQGLLFVSTEILQLFYLPHVWLKIKKSRKYMHSPKTSLQSVRVILKLISSRLSIMFNRNTITEKYLRASIYTRWLTFRKKWLNELLQEGQVELFSNLSIYKRSDVLTDNNFFQGYTGGNRSYKCKFTFPTPLSLQPASHADHFLIGHEHFRVVSAKPPHRYKR